jgi:cytochrome c biogenesis protein CcdA
MLAKKGQSQKTNVLRFVSGLGIMYALFYVVLAAMILFIQGLEIEGFLTTTYTLLYAFAAILCMLFALQSIEKINFFGTTVDFRRRLGFGAKSAFISGALFATVISPCNLPFLLAGILPLIQSNATFIEGILSIASFSLFLALPMLAIGLGSSYILDRFVKEHIEGIEKISAIFLFGVSLYFIHLIIESIL